MDSSDIDYGKTPDNVVKNSTDEYRDADRIKRILSHIEKIWTVQPDLTLGQLLVNANVNFKNNIYNYQDNLLEYSLYNYDNCNHEVFYFKIKDKAKIVTVCTSNTIQSFLLYHPNYSFEKITQEEYETIIKNNKII